ncbi:MAG: endonuclease III [Eubacteriaceae bacterium]|jgi:endonuclease-3|nr:endonuclease III [Eubacteriaceae bacterium]
MDNETALAILAALKKSYPDARCGLDYETPYELAVATILSAQCTDKRVNIVTKSLFSQASTPQAIAEMGVDRLQRVIRPCGLSNAKAKNIVSMSEILLREHGGMLPETVDELVRLPGIGRKTANVVASNAFGQDAIAVDTHVFRVSNRLGLARAANPLQTEKDLNACLPKNEWSLAHHLLIRHGRDVCHARKPACQGCALLAYCESGEAGAARAEAGGAGA